MTGATLGIAVVLFVAAAVQGASGLGFALVSSPAVQTVQPGRTSVGLLNALGVLQNLLIIARARRRPDWRTAGRLIAAILVGVVVGGTAARHLSPTQTAVTVAVSTVFSLALLVFGSRLPPWLRSAAVCGTISGIVTVTAAVGGPPVAAHLVHRIDDHDQYIATQQVVFAVTSLASLFLLPLPTAHVDRWAVWVTATVLGSVCGQQVRRRLAARQLRRATVVVIAVVATFALAHSTLLLAS